MKVDFTEGKTRLGDGDGKYVDNFHSVGEGQSQGQEEDPTAGGRNTVYLQNHNVIMFIRGQRCWII